MPTKTAKRPSPPTPRNLRAAADAVDHALQGAAASRYPVQDVPCAEIVDDGHNHRENIKADDAAIAELAKSMGEGGQLQAVRVFRGADGKYHLIFGFRRLQAGRKLKWPTIRAEVVPIVVSDAERHRQRAEENLKRRNLTPAEETIAVHELVEANAPMHGLEKAIDKAAADLGQSRKWVDDRYRVFEKLCKAGRILLGEGKLNLGQARALIKIGDGDVQEMHAKDIARSFDRGAMISVQQVEGFVQDHKHSLKVVPWDVGASMKTGVKGCDRCIGCAHNTATNPTFFDVGKDEAKDGVGSCTLSLGFEAKEQMTAKAQQEAVKKIRKQVQSKQVEKSSAASAPVVREAVEEYVRPETVQRLVKKEMGAPKEAAGKGTKGAKGGAAKPAKKETEKDRRCKAQAKWANAFGEWRRQLDQEVDRVLQKDPHLLLAMAAINLSAAADSHEQYLLYYWEGSGFAEPKPEKAVSPKLAAMLDRVQTRSYESLLALAAEPHPDLMFNSLVTHGGPEFCSRIAKAFGVTPKKPQPVFEDFLPEDLRPTKPETKPTEAKAAAAGKSIPFPDGAVVALRMGGDVGHVVGHTGNQLSVKWLDGSESTVAQSKLRIATLTEVEEYHGRRNTKPDDFEDEDEGRAGDSRDE